MPKTGHVRPLAQLAIWVCVNLITLIWATGAMAQSAPPTSQTPAPPANAASQLLRVFLDCDPCDEEYLRQNVQFIDYVRDRTVADLHVLVTTQGTGGGGSSWVVKFIGLGRFQGQDRTLTFTTPSTATSDDRRKEFARIFRLGLVAYAADTAAASKLDVTYSGATSATPAVVKDPWNFWAFRINTNGDMNGEKSSTGRSYSVSVSANRVTERWKVNIGAYTNRRTSDFDIDETTTVRSRTSSWEYNGLVVKSVGPHWSAGITAGASHSSFSNTDLQFSMAPGIEYDVFPYGESSRRSLAIRYTAGPVDYEYAELTVFDKIHETIPKHYLNVSLGLRQPWGSLNLYSNLSQQLNHLDRYRASVFGETNVRIFKGFSFNMFGQYDRILDQISLRKGIASEAEVLLRVQQLQTNYSYSMFFGVSYSFGSIFNSVVNPRFTF